MFVLGHKCITSTLLHLIELSDDRVIKVEEAEEKPHAENEVEHEEVVERSREICEFSLNDINRVDGYHA